MVEMTEQQPRPDPVVLDTDLAGTEDRGASTGRDDPVVFDKALTSAVAGTAKPRGNRKG
jgi:hypothetical protein